MYIISSPKRRTSSLLCSHIIFHQQQYLCFLRGKITVRDGSESDKKSIGCHNMAAMIYWMVWSCYVYKDTSASPKTKTSSPPRPPPATLLPTSDTRADDDPRRLRFSQAELIVRGGHMIGSRVLYNETDMNNIKWVGGRYASTHTTPRPRRIHLRHHGLLPPHFFLPATLVPTTTHAVCASHEEE